jgi:hypothetical protein
MQYAVPVVVLGGSYPHYYEITGRTGPASISNATIGNRRAYSIGVNWYETQDWEDYGTLRWTPAPGDEGQTFSFTIRVTGQDGASATVTYSGTVQSDKFVFLDANAAPGGDGSFTSPFIDFDDLWTGPDDTTFDGKILVFRAGRYDPRKCNARNLQDNLGLPCVFIGFPGDAKWVLDQGLLDGGYWSVGRPDLWLSDCYVDGCNNSSYESNNWFWKVTWWNPGNVRSQSRITIWNNVLHNFQGALAVPGDSCAGWFSFLSPRYPPDYEQRQHLCVIKNVFDTAFPTTSTGKNYGSCVTLYGTTKSVIEHNVAKEWGVYRPWWLKIQDSYMSVRANMSWSDGGYAVGVTITMTNYGGVEGRKGGHNEICWNFDRNIDSSSTFNTEEYDTGQSDPTYIYRNTTVKTGNYFAGLASIAIDNKEENASPTNVIVGLNNANYVSKVRVDSDGPWYTYAWDNSLRGYRTDQIAKTRSPLSTFSGNIFAQDQRIDFTTGRFTGAWESLSGLKGAYIE